MEVHAPYSLCGHMGQLSIFGLFVLFTCIGDMLKDIGCIAVRIITPVDLREKVVEAH